MTELKDFLERTIGASLTARELEDELGLTAGVVFRWKSGQSEPDPALIPMVIETGSRLFEEKERKQFSGLLTTAFRMGLEKGAVSSRFHVTLPTVDRWQTGAALPGQYLRTEVREWIYEFADTFDFPGLIKQSVEQGLSHDTLRDTFAVSTGTIKRWEKGNNQPQKMAIPQIAGRIYELLDELPSPQP